MPSITSETEAPTENHKTQKSRYPVLEIIAFLYQLLAVLFIVGTVAVVVIFFVQSNANDLNARAAYPVVIAFVGGIIISAILWSSAEVISLFIHIEENTRRTADLLQRQIEEQRKE